MAVAIGATIQHGIKIEMVDINESVSDFSPNAKDNYISYGLRSLTGIGSDIIEKIVNLRPFSSIEDFQNKVKPTKNQMLSLIKSGAFMKIDNKDRKRTLLKYAELKTAKRVNLSISQLPLLENSNLIPQNLRENYDVYRFNKYLRKELKKKGDFVVLEETAEKFLSYISEEDLIEQQGDAIVLDLKKWDKVYKSYMDEVRLFLKENKEDLLRKIFFAEVSDLFIEYGGKESLSKWEMDSMNFYYTEHELKDVSFEKYNITKFTSLPREPQKLNPNARFSRNVLSVIVGTVISKNKTKGSLYVLTPEGDVVLVKMYKGAFSYWDKQISRLNQGGKKEVVEKSFFERGNKVLFTGFRRNDQFIPKSYSDTLTPDVALITGLNKDGSLFLRDSRAVV